jgi:hypothetical protein
MITEEGRVGDSSRLVTLNDALDFVNDYSRKAAKSYFIERDRKNTSNTDRDLY